LDRLGITANDHHNAETETASLENQKARRGRGLYANKFTHVGFDEDKHEAAKD
jgi:hypothetical protein